MLLPINSVNQRLPAGPVVMPAGPQPVGYAQVPIRWNSVMLPLGVMRPIRFPSNSVNQRLPSGPAVMPTGSQPPESPQFVGRGNSVMLPAGVLRPIWFTASSVYHRLPSGPVVMSFGPLLLVGGREPGELTLGVLRPVLLSAAVS